MNPAAEAEGRESQASHVILRDTKNGDDRAVPLSQDALAIVKGMLERHEGELVFPVTRSALVSAWRRMKERAGIDDFRFQDLRHEATSRLFERGLTTMEVQKMTGHKTLSMLLRYTQMDVGHVVKRLDATEDADKADRVRVTAYKVNTLASEEEKVPAPLPANVVPFRPRR